MEFYNSKDEKINLFELGKTNGVPNSQNEFGIIELGEYDCNEISYSGLYRIYGDGQKNTPYNNGWIIRVETFKETHITQYATVTGSLETYKRKLYDGKWTDWLLVEGECSLWTGSLAKRQSATIDRLNQFKRFKISIESSGDVTCQRENDRSINGITFWNNGVSSRYLSVVDLQVSGNTITNDTCGYINFTEIVNGDGQLSLPVIKIIGIP